MNFSSRTKFPQQISIAALFIGIALFASVGIHLGISEIKKTARASAKVQIPNDITERSVLSKVPGISARAYLVANLETGEVYAEKDSLKVYPIASITKLMTAVAANESMEPNHQVKISETSLQAYGNSANLKKDEVFTLGNILYPLLMVSSNDAALAIAEEYGVSRFVSQMNSQAASIGMDRSNFADPAGISPKNTSTASDLFILASYLYKKKGFLLDITRQPEKLVASSLREHLISNMNIFSSEKSFLGGKTGFTISAKETFLSLFEIEKDGKKVPVAFIVLGSDDRKKDVGVLLEWVRSESSGKVASL